MRRVRTAVLFAILFALGSGAHAEPRKKKPRTSKTQVASVQACAEAIKAAASEDSSARSGMLQHREHFADLILAQGASLQTRHIQAFETMVRDLIAGIAAGAIPLLNEKFDGSPAVALGFTPGTDQPFVTYKADIPELDKQIQRKKQRLPTTVAEAEKAFPNLKQIMAPAIEHLGPGMRKVVAELKDYIFQGDLLFTPQGEQPDKDGKIRIIRENHRITLQPNAVPYVLERGTPEFAAIASARVGIVIHTVSRRTVRPDGLLAAVPLETEEQARVHTLISRLVAALSSREAFAIDPWQTHVPTARQVAWTPETQATALALLESVQSKLASLSPEFRKAWSGNHLAQFRIFFNSSLRPGARGGIYRRAAEGLALDWDGLVRKMRGFTYARAGGPVKESYVQSLENFYSEHGKELEVLIRAYYDAIRLHYTLAPYLNEAARSKLGGGEIEGMMLETHDTVVKFVDRLDFTVRNNARRGTLPNVEISEGTPRGPPQFSDLPEPFNRWQPGAAFVLMKGQPVHSGHLRMIRRAVEMNPGAPVYVIASNREADLAASAWGDLGLTDTKKELEARDYTYIFSGALKREILESGLNGAAPVYILNPGTLWSYLKIAQATGAQGQVKVVMGQKEWDRARYDDQLEEHAVVLDKLVVDMQSEGISGTQVRRALRDFVLEAGEKRQAALAVLEAALAEIPTKKRRKQLLNKLAKEWEAADSAAQRALGNHE